MHERTSTVSIRLNTVSCPTPKIGGVMVSFMVSEVVFLYAFYDVIDRNLKKILT